MGSLVKCTATKLKDGVICITKIHISHQESIEGRRWEAAVGNCGRLIRTRAGEKGGRDRESDRRREWQRR